MKTGLIFIIMAALIYWGYYYTRDFLKENSKKIEKTKTTAIEKSKQTVHKANIHILQTSIQIFKQRTGRYPKSLKELVKKGYLSKIPDPGDKDWKYNPKTGKVK